MEIDSHLERLRGQVKECEAQLAALKHQLALAEAHQNRISNGSKEQVKGSIVEAVEPGVSKKTSWPLSLEEYRRYGRQLIMPEIGLEGR